jgi:lauroyl/myristoyl acyltransferase
LLYLGYLIARLLARTMPLGVCYWMAERAADVWYAASPRTRANVAYNLGLVPGSPHEGRPRGRLTRRMLRNFARVVTEFLYLPRVDAEGLASMVDLDSFRGLTDTLAGRHGILVTSHLGNWEIAAVATASLGIDLRLVVYDHPDRRVARLFRKIRKAKGLEMMSVKRAAREIVGSIRKASIGIVGDRDYSGKGKEARFLGAGMRVPSAYAGLAVAMRVPVVVGFCVRRPDGKYGLVFQETVYDPRRHTMTADEIVQACLRLFEKGVEKYTEQWYFFGKVGARWGPGTP